MMLSWGSEVDQWLEIGEQKINLRSASISL